DPGRLEIVESRLSVLDGIKRKYGGTLEAAIAERPRLESQIGATQDLEVATSAAEKARDGRRADLEGAAARLTKARGGAARRMQKAVAAGLAGLRLEDARFEVELRTRSETGPDG